MGKRLDRCAAQLQERADEAGRIHRVDPAYVQRNTAAESGWLYFLSYLPGIGWIFRDAIVRRTRRLRERRRVGGDDEQPANGS